jgi:hypothetical protein
MDTRYIDWGRRTKILRAKVNLLNPNIRLQEIKEEYQRQLQALREQYQRELENAQSDYNRLLQVKQKYLEEIARLREQVAKLIEKIHELETRNAYLEGLLSRGIAGVPVSEVSVTDAIDRAVRTAERVERESEHGRRAEAVYNPPMSGAIRRAWRGEFIGLRSYKDNLGRTHYVVRFRDYESGGVVAEKHFNSLEEAREWARKNLGVYVA